MKKQFKKILPVFLLLFLAMSFSNSSEACVDPDTTVVKVTVTYDTTNAPFIDHVIIRLSNLRLMNEEPNKVCACALTKWSPLFTNLDYVLFVDAGTNSHYAGFSKFDGTSESSTEWNSSTSSGDWSGYIATVINSGLKSDVPVDLVIRASPPSGVQYTLNGDSSIQQFSLVEAVNSARLGTDEWNPTTNKLVDAHRGIQNFSMATDVSYEQKPAAYFTSFDTEIASSIKASIDPILLIGATLQVFPNPFAENLVIELDLAKAMDLEVFILDLQGREHVKLDKEYFNAGLSNVDLSTYTHLLSKGNYFVRIQSEEGSVIKHIIRQ
ncbi:MAG: hypothetical protein COA58_15805 [Bacteroidetes bacterium]|nr:MAG: hypothetical protein COA58_15805 [Bacteroidota bacterium]